VFCCSGEPNEEYVAHLAGQIEIFERSQWLENRPIFPVDTPATERRPLDWMRDALGVSR
jgi:hypothetical protein